MSSEEINTSELLEIKYNFIVHTTKFFLEQYRIGKEVKTLDQVVSNIKKTCSFVEIMNYTFDETIWPETKPDWNKDLIEFRAYLVGGTSYLPFRLFVSKGTKQGVILLKPGTFFWNYKD